MLVQCAKVPFDIWLEGLLVACTPVQHHDVEFGHLREPHLGPDIVFSLGRFCGGAMLLPTAMIFLPPLSNFHQLSNFSTTVPIISAPESIAVFTQTKDTFSGLGCLARGVMNTSNGNGFGPQGDVRF